MNFSNITNGKRDTDKRLRVFYYITEETTLPHCDMKLTTHVITQFTIFRFTVVYDFIYNCLYSLQW